MSKRSLSDNNSDDELSKILKLSDSDDEFANERREDSDWSDDDAAQDGQDDAEALSGEEDGEAREEEGQRMTAFNMTEELQEGRFDSAGHFIWNREREIRDNWIDSLSWRQINVKPLRKRVVDESESDSDLEDNSLMEKYSKILTYMKPGETVNATIRRLAANTTKLSSMERLKLKKEGKLVESKDVEIITELANQILTKAGDMNVYEMTYEYIKNKLKGDGTETATPVAKEELDMFADDFTVKEKEKLGAEAGPSGTQSIDNEASTSSTMETDKSSSHHEEVHDDNDNGDVMWEFKRDINSENVEGPFTSRQMHEWSVDGYFGESGVYVRKYGKSGNFYSTKRIDFEIFI